MNDQKAVWYVIFQSRNGSAEMPWLDYCREKSPFPNDFHLTQAWATKQCTIVEKQIDKPMRATYEQWRD